MPYVFLSKDISSPYHFEHSLYFPSEKKFLNAEELWYQAKDAKLKLEWINKNLFPLNLKIDPQLKDLRIGDKNATMMNIFIFFNEIFMNIIQAAAHVDENFRKCDMELFIGNNAIQVNVANIAHQSCVNPKKGFECNIIDHYCRFFKIENFCEEYNAAEKLYTLHFSLPLLNNGGAK